MTFRETRRAELRDRQEDMRARLKHRRHTQEAEALLAVLNARFAATPTDAVDWAAISRCASALSRVAKGAATALRPYTAPQRD